MSGNLKFLVFLVASLCMHCFGFLCGIYGLVGRHMHESHLERSEQELWNMCDKVSKCYRFHMAEAAQKRGLCREEATDWKRIQASLG